MGSLIFCLARNDDIGRTFRIHYLEVLFMCKLNALLPLCCLIAGTLYAQSPETFGDRLIVGTSMTYVWETDETIPNRYLSLDLAFLFHDTYGTWRETTGYNIYIIGLNVNLGLR